MIEIKYEKPLEYYTVDNFIRESSQMIGKPAPGIEPTYSSAKYDFIAAYANALGDDNPLYHDLWYAVSTRHEGLIAPPTFLITIKYPISLGPLYDGPYPLAGFESEFDWTFSDTIKMNDSFTTEMILKDVYEKPHAKGRMVCLVSECKYRNELSNKLVATCRGTFAAIARAESITEIPEAIEEGFRKQPLTDREVYCHSEEEIQRIVDDLNGVVRRGPQVRYWEDVNVGDPLDQVVKAPLTTGDLVSYVNAAFSARAFPNFGLNIRKWLTKPGSLRSNPTTGWPYDVFISDHVDPYMSAARGMPNEFGWGTQKAGFCDHLLSNWMGDDGFIRSLKVNTLEPYIYGDAVWVKGEVVEKYKEKLGGVLYGAVDVKLAAVNQLGQNIATGTATVYLSTVSCPVKLPLKGEEI